MSLRQLLAEGRPVLIDGASRRRWRSSAPTSADPLWTARVLRDSPELVARRARGVRRRGRGDRDQRELPGAGRAARGERARGAARRRAGRRVGGALRRVAGRRRGVHGPLRGARRASTSGGCGCCWTPSRTASRSRRSRGSTRRCRSSGCSRRSTRPTPGSRSRAATVSSRPTASRSRRRWPPWPRRRRSSRSASTAPRRSSSTSCCARARSVTEKPLIAYPNAGPHLRRGVEDVERRRADVGLRRRADRRRLLRRRAYGDRRRECQAPSEPRVNASRSCSRFGRPSQNSIASGTSRKPPQCGGRGTSSP